VNPKSQYMFMTFIGRHFDVVLMSVC